MELQLVVNGIISGSLYALVAFGFSLIYRSTKIFHIAHAAIFTSSAYFLYFFYKQVNLGLPLSVALSILGAGLLGILLERIVYFPLFKNEASSSVMLASSLGIMIILINLIAMIWGNDTKIFISGVSRTFKLENPFLGNEAANEHIIITLPQLLQFSVPIIIILVTFIFLRKTKTGKKIYAICDNNRLIEIFGISLKRYRMLIFFLGSIMAGLANILISIDIGATPYRGMPILLIAAVAVIIGGEDNFIGSVVGGFVLGFAQAVAIWQIGEKWEDVAVFLLLILFLLLRPQGILGKKIRGV